MPYLQSLLKHIESILASPSTKSWTHRWLDVIKQGAADGGSKAAAGGGGAGVTGPKGAMLGRRKTLSGSFGGKRVDLPYGFGDGMSKTIVEHSVHNSVAHLNGAVRAHEPSRREPCEAGGSRVELLRPSTRPAHISALRLSDDPSSPPRHMCTGASRSRVVQLLLAAGPRRRVPRSLGRLPVKGQMGAVRPGRAPRIPNRAYAPRWGSNPPHQGHHGGSYPHDSIPPQARQLQLHCHSAAIPPTLVLFAPIPCGQAWPRASLSLSIPNGSCATRGGTTSTSPYARAQAPSNHSTRGCRPPPSSGSALPRCTPPTQRVSSVSSLPKVKQSTTMAGSATWLSRSSLSNATRPSDARR